MLAWTCAWRCADGRECSTQVLEDAEVDRSLAGLYRPRNGMSTLRSDPADNVGLEWGSFQLRLEIGWTVGKCTLEWTSSCSIGLGIVCA